MAYLQPKNLLRALQHTDTHTHTSPDAPGIQQTGSNFQTGLARLTTAQKGRLVTESVPKPERLSSTPPIWPKFLSAAVYTPEISSIRHFHPLDPLRVNLGRVSPGEPGSSKHNRASILLRIHQRAAHDLFCPASLWPGWFTDTISSVCSKLAELLMAQAQFLQSQIWLSRLPHEAGIL